MFSFLQHDLPAFGRVLYPGAIPPPADQLTAHPEGPMNPRNIGAARRLRETRAVWQARIDEAKRSGA